MRACAALVAVILLAGLYSCATEKKVPVEGAWELISQEITTSDSVYTFPASEFERQIKIIGKTHFAFVRQDTSQSDPSLAGGGGRYTFDNGIYTEYMEFFENPALVGTTLHYNCQFEGDRWTMTGPVNGSDDVGWTLHEVWMKLD